MYFNQDKKKFHVFARAAAVDSKLSLDLSNEENESLVTALRNTFLPRLVERDASLFATLIRDLWPSVTVPLHFGGHDEPKVRECCDVTCRS